MVADSGDQASPRARMLPSGKGVVWFGASALVNAIGTGFFYPFTLLFFHSVMRLPYPTVGIGLTATALIVLPAVQRIGRLVDRVGPRRVLISADVLRTLAFTGYVLVRSLAAFLILSAVVAMCNRAEQTATPALAAVTSPDGQSATWLALYRTVLNVGVGIGAVGGSLALVLSSGAYRGLGLADAVSFGCAAVLYGPLRELRTSQGRRSGTSRPWRNMLYTQLAAANALLWLVAVALETGASAYIVADLRLPTWMVGLLFAVNTALVTVLQLPAAGYISVRNPFTTTAVGAALNGAILVLLGVLGMVSRPGVAVDAGLLTVAMVIYTLGELLTFQGLIVLLTAIPPTAERGSYLAFSQTLAGAMTALVWLMVTVFLNTWPAGLWWTLLLLVCLVAVGAAGLRHRVSVGGQVVSPQPSA